jgi:hypothetical protein
MKTVRMLPGEYNALLKQHTTDWWILFDTEKRECHIAVGSPLGDAELHEQRLHIHDIVKFL